MSRDWPRESSSRRDSALRRIKITDTIYSPAATIDRREGENVTSRWGRYAGRTYVESRQSLRSMRGTRRRMSSAGPTSANGITLTQWHSDYIIAGLSSGCPLSFAPREPGPITGTSASVVLSRFFSHHGSSSLRSFGADTRSAPTRRLFSGDKWRGRQRVMSANEAAGEQPRQAFCAWRSLFFATHVSSSRAIPPRARITKFRRYRVSGMIDMHYNSYREKINNFSIYNIHMPIRLQRIFHMLVVTKNCAQKLKFALLWL